MDDQDIDEHAEDDVFDDNSYQACYIFRSSDKVSDKRPSKKRKLNGASHTTHIFPKLAASSGSESLAETRWRLFDEFWEKQRLKLSQDDVNTTTLSDLSHYLRKGPDFTQKGRLKTALLLTGLDEANQASLIRRVSAEVTADHSRVLVNLQTRQCSNLQNALKNLIKTVITEHSGSNAFNDFLVRHKRLSPLNFDLELLEQFVGDRSISQIIVSLSDAEAFDSHVLNDLVNTLHLWQRQLPFALLLGISSTKELFEHRLSKSCLKYIDASLFDFAPRADLASDVIQRLQRPGDDVAMVYLGPSIIASLAEFSKNQGKTIQSLASTLHYLYMSHFLANPLAVMLEPSSKNAGKVQAKILAEAIRNTESFKTSCDDLLAEKTKVSTTKVRKMLEDDTFLLEQAQEAIAEGQRAYESSLEVLHNLAEFCHVLLQTGSKKQNPKLDMLSELCQAIHEPTDTDLYEEAERYMQNMPPADLLEILDGLRSSVLAALNIGTAIASLRNQIHPVTNGDDIEVNGVSTKQNDNAGMLTTPRKRGKLGNATTPKSQTLKHNAGQVSSAKDEFIEALRSKITSASLDVSSLLLHEAYILSTRVTRSKPNFEPNPRAAVERALLRPGDYLSWHQAGGGSGSDYSDAYTNGEPSENQQSHMPSTSLMFTILQEAPTIINVRDFFDAFQSRLAPQPAHTNGINMDDPDDQELKSTMTQFYRALAELKMIGLVKSSTGTQVRRATKGKSSKSGTQDIDFVAKTSWAGL